MCSLSTGATSQCAEGLCPGCRAPGGQPFHYPVSHRDPRQPATVSVATGTHCHLPRQQREYREGGEGDSGNDSCVYQQPHFRWFGLHFLQFCLARDVLSSLRKPVTALSQFMTAPLVRTGSSVPAPVPYCVPQTQLENTTCTCAESVLLLYILSTLNPSLSWC